MNPLGHKNWNRTISWVVSGVRDFRKSGTGTITLSAANTFTGGVIVAAGTLSSTAHNSTESASGLGAATNNISIAAGATLELAATGGVTTLTGNISGTGSISQNNGSSFAVSLAGDNSGFSGTYTMQTGCIALSFNSATSGSASATWVLNGNTGSPRIGARYGSAAQAWLPGLTTGTSNTIKLGSVSTTSTTIQIGNNTSQASQTGETTWEIGELNASTTFAGVVVDTVVGSTAFTSSKVNIKKVGTGTLTLTGTNTYTGVTTLSAGKVTVATIGNGGVSGNLGAATNAASNLVLVGGTLQYTGATASTNRAFTLTAATTSTIEVTANNITFSGNVAATSGSLGKTGAGILTLSGDNSLWSGEKYVTAGIMAFATDFKSSGTGQIYASNCTIRSAGAYVVPAIEVGANVVLDAGGATQEGWLGAVSGSGTVSIVGHANFPHLTGNFSAFTGTATFSGSVTCHDQFAGSASAAFVVSSGAILLVSNEAGTVNRTIYFGSLSGSGNVYGSSTSGSNAGTKTLEVGGLNASTTFSGVISNAHSGGGSIVAVTKIGTGTLTFSGANTYTGLTQISVGTLNWSGSAVSNSVRIDVSNASPTTSNSGKMITSGALALSGKTINAVVTETGTFNYEFADNAAATDGAPTWQINGSNVVSGITNGNGTTLTYDSVTGNGTISR